MSVEQTSIIIAAISVLIAILTFAFNRLHNHGEQKHWQGQTTSTLNNISEDVKDMKIQQRQSDKQLAKTEELALQAKNAADKAHKRLDMIHAPSAYGNNGE